MSGQTRLISFPRRRTGQNRSCSPVGLSVGAEVMLIGIGHHIGSRINNAHDNVEIANTVMDQLVGIRPHIHTLQDDFIEIVDIFFNNRFSSQLL